MFLAVTVEGKSSRNFRRNEIPDGRVEALIAASNFSLTSAAAPVSTAGQAIDVTGGPKVPTTSPVGTLDTARKVIQADVAFGQGTSRRLTPPPAPARTAAAGPRPRPRTSPQDVRPAATTVDLSSFTARGDRSGRKRAKVRC